MIRLKTIFCAFIFFTASLIDSADSLAVMAVDLGTEFMKIAIVKPGIPMEIALNKESRRKTPIIVAIKGKDREFGDAAISRSNKIPGQSYAFLRELVGKSLDNPVIQQYLKRFPYYKMKIDSTTNQLVFEHDNETNYNVEELLAMILKKAREYASDFAEQTVDSAVITVPPYFTQSERRAVQRACELANIKLLQLMNDNTAVALNYGIFRRKDFNSTGSTYLFYDMGSQSTTCTLATFNVIKSKENGYLEEIPQLTIKAVAFDRDLGGLEFQIRLRNFFAEKFHEKHPKIDVFQNSKALVKLFREAERAKHVLSANNEYTAQVEGLIDEIDFKQRITRDEFEKLCSDLFERVRRPLDEVLSTSGVTLTEIQQILLFGGSTRIPRVQNELISKLGGIELGKSLNTDEAAAMGAVYQAASLSKGFRVKKFLVKDSNQYPINVIFERQTDHPDQKFMDKTLFHRQTLYANRKVITFNRYIDDFSFDVHYGNLTFLSSNDLHSLGKTDLFRIHVKGVRTAYEKHKETCESKGVKAHFHLDESCFMTLDRMEFVFERKQNQTNDETKKESTFSKLGNKISSFFSSKSGNSADDDTNIESGIPTNEEIDLTNKTTNVTNSSSSSSTTIATPIVSTIKENLKYEIEIRDFVDPSAEMRSQSVRKLNDLDAHDRELVALSKAKNNLESFIYDIRDKLEHDVKYKKASTVDEKTAIEEKLTEIDAWLWDQGIDADVKALQSKLDELKTLTKSLKLRVKESELRPKKFQELKEALNMTENFFLASKQLFSKKDDEDRPFTDGELKYVEKLIKETYMWRDQVQIESEKLSPTDTPKYLSTDFDEKINALKRESAFLLNKVQRFVPKPKTTSTSSTKSTANNDTTTTTTAETDRPEL